jgi:predicted nucleic acid-binding protein
MRKGGNEAARVLDAWNSKPIDMCSTRNYAYHMSKMIQIRNVPDDPHTTLLPSVWRYRHTLSAYDAAYVVPAETRGATLTTRDPRLASAHGHTAKIELF